jgi:hypothetical protein
MAVTMKMTPIINQNPFSPTDKAESTSIEI